jgi:hypothetical protein
MAYPTTRPDFNSGTPFSAWFGVSQGSGAERRLRLCATTGRAFIKRLQRKLLAVAPPEAGLSSTATWDQPTANTLVWYARRLAELNPGSGMSGFVERLRLAAERKEVTLDALRFAIWVAYLDGTPNPIESVQLNTDTAFPVFGVAAPHDGNFAPPAPAEPDAAVCWFPDTEPLPSTALLAPNGGEGGEGNSIVRGLQGALGLQNGLTLTHALVGGALVVGGVALGRHLLKRGRKGKKSKGKSKAK